MDDGTLGQRAQAARQAISLLEAIVADFHPEFGGGEISASAYDTAWAAMVRDPHDPHRLAFPLSFAWLIRHQAPDGSYSGPFPQTIVPTLAALLALKRAPEQGERICGAAAKAEAYLQAALPRWDVKNHESVGFEVIVPGLLQQLEALGTTLSFPAKGPLLALFEEKLRIIDAERLYRTPSSMAFSLEAIGSRLNWTRLGPQRHPNGHYGCSASSTAGALVFGPWDVAAARWLGHLYERGFGGEQGAMPDFFAIDVFELSWAVYNLSHGGFDMRRDCPPVLFEAIVKRLGASLQEHGTGATRFSGLPPDADDTGMVIAALNLCGVQAPVDPLLRFERDGCFTCYEGERNPSSSATAHALAGLLSYPEATRRRFGPMIERTTRFLLDVRHPDGYWMDKWHSSPYYATACCAQVLAEAAGSRAVQPSVHWVQATRQADGGWGAGGRSTLEETAYAALTLRASVPMRERTEPVTGVLAGYLSRQRSIGHDVRSTKLWTGKEPYAVARIDSSYVLGATIGGA